MPVAPVRVLVDGIKYQRLGDEHYYAQELFEQEELTGYLKNMLTDIQKSVTEQVVYQSEVEANFAREMELNVAGKVYAKLPGWFQVPTPLGPYNPDWAVLIDTDEGERLHFVVETKGTPYIGDLTNLEAGKIACGRTHFESLHIGEERVRYEVATELDDVLAKIG